MNKLIILLLAILSASILFANVCWDNGAPLFEGNYIYHSHSVKTENDDIYICWMETDEGMRKLKLQKTNYQGVPIWNDPVTIDDSDEFMIDLDLLNSTNNEFYMPVHLYLSGTNRLYKLDENGSILWTNEYDDDYWDNFLPLENGGIINLRIDTNQPINYLLGTYFDDNGNVIWDDIPLTILPDELQNQEIVCRNFVDNELNVIFHNNGEIFFMKFDENGNHLFTSNAYPSYFLAKGKFMNDHFYVIFDNSDDNELKMWQFDTNGNSISGTEPIIISSLNEYYFRYLLAGDDYFNCLSIVGNDGIKLLKCDYQGNLLDEEIIDTNDFCHFSVYDQEQDFIEISGNSSSGHESFLVKIDADGAGENISYLPENIYFYSLDDRYYIDNGFTMTGNLRDNHEFVTTLRKTEVSTTINEIRKMENDLTSPTLIKQPDGLHTHWYSYSKGAIMNQVFDENGEPQLEENGEILIDDEWSFYFHNNVYYCFEISNFDDTADTVSIKAYDVSGNPLWSETEEFVIQDGYHNHVGITPFYDGLLFHIATDLGNWMYSEMEAMYFDESGFLWNDTVTLDFGYLSTYRYYKFKGSFLFHELDGNVCGVQINEDGSCEDQFMLAVYSKITTIVGTYEDFLVGTYIDDSDVKNLHYFHNGVQMWNYPLSIHVYSLYNLTPFFADDHFYLTGFNSDETITINQYDYDKNLIEENSFSFTSFNPNLHDVNTFHKNGYFIFFIQSSDANYDLDFSYTVYDEAGNQLIAEFDETLMDRQNMEHIEDIEFIDDYAYLDLTTGIKYMEGAYERNHYIQKIDLTDFVPTSENEISTAPCNLHNFPNPFNPSTTISFDVMQTSSFATIEIYNLKGQKVKTFSNLQITQSPNQQIIWNGTDDNKKAVGSGIYFYKLNLDGKTRAVRKCLLVK